MEIFVLRDGQQTGPFNPETVQTLCERGGLSHQDMAWHKGLPGWLPLGEVLNPGSERPSAPPPTPISSGIRQAPKKSATAKQKALLKYLGAEFEEGITKEEAAIVISDALETPKFTAKFQRWGEERLTQHADLYQDEIDFRRANRVARYLERCQTEAAEAVSDVTKAHVQVLVESLDKKNPNWERDQKGALWNHLLPAIADHFPQLVQEKWKNRLRPAQSRVATAIAKEDALPIHEPEPAPGVFSAALRGLVYGGVVLGLILGANHLFKKPEAVTDGKTPAPNATPAHPAAPGTPPAAPEGTANTLPPAPAAPAPVVDATPSVPAAPAPAAPAPPAVPDPGLAPAPAMAAAPAPAPAPAADPAMAPSADPSMAPAAPAAPTPGMDVPAAPAGDPVSGGFKNVLTITKPVAVQLQFGKVTLNTGTRVRFIALEGANVRVNFNNNVILVPAIATDVDPTAVPPAPAPPAVSAPLAPPAPAPAPVTAPPTTPKPSSDL